MQPVPIHLRDKSGQASKREGHGKGYLYSHEFPEGISGQDYLTRPLTLYTPKVNGLEARIAERLERWRGLKFGYEVWEKQGDWVSIGYNELGRAEVRYDVPLIMQVAMLRCR